ncbi:MAG: hypothetical protein WCO88_12650 [Actinomycetota bacterium]
MNYRIWRRIVAATALVAGGIGVSVAFGPAGVVSAAAQGNGCFVPISSAWTTFQVPLNGTPSTSSIASGGSVTLANTTVGISIDTAIIQAGFTAGVVALGTNTVAATVKLTITGTNTVQGTQTVQGTSNLSFTVTDTGAGTIAVSPSPITATVNVADSTWTSNGGGNIVFSEAATAPDNATTPGVASRNSAPLQILNRVNNAINANFHCWAGSGGPAPAVFAPSATSPIASVNVTAPATTVPATTTPTGSTTPGTTTPVTTSPGTTTPGTTSPGTTTTTIVNSSTSTTVAPTTTLPAGPTFAEYASTCSNSVTPQASVINFKIAGLAPASAGQNTAVALRNISWTIAVPGAIFDTGINLGLVNPGDKLPGVVEPAMKVTNGTPATLTPAAQSVQIGPVAVDAGGAALPATVVVTSPDQSVTATGGPLTFSMGTTKITVSIGALKVIFTCAAPSTTPFASTTVTGSSPTTTVVGSGGPTSTVPGSRLPPTGVSGVSLSVIAFIGLAVLQLGIVLLGGARRRGTS